HHHPQRHRQHQRPPPNQRDRPPRHPQPDEQQRDRQDFFGDHLDRRRGLHHRRNKRSGHRRGQKQPDEPRDRRRLKCHRPAALSESVLLPPSAPRIQPPVPPPRDQRDRRDPQRPR